MGQSRGSCAPPQLMGTRASAPMKRTLLGAPRRRHSPQPCSRRRGRCKPRLVNAERARAGSRFAAFSRLPSDRRCSRVSELRDRDPARFRRCRLSRRPSPCRSHRAPGGDRDETTRRRRRHVTRLAHSCPERERERERERESNVAPRRGDPFRDAGRADRASSDGRRRRGHRERGDADAQRRGSATR
jgi:hypothetical protein